MGWTGCYLKKGANLNEFFEKEFSCQFIGGGKLVHLSEYYRPFVQKDGKYNVMVCLVHYKPKEDFNFSFKSMSADMGPFYFNCPEQIIKMVEGNFTDNEEARKWLEECEKRIEQRKQKKLVLKGIQTGDIIRFSGTYTFKGGKEYNSFVCYKIGTKILLRAYNRETKEIGYKVNLGSWKQEKFEVVGNIGQNIY